VVKEGRILHFVSGDRRSGVKDMAIQKIINSITDEPTLKINHLRGKSVSGFLFHARFTPGFVQNRRFYRRNQMEYLFKFKQAGGSAFHSTVHVMLRRLIFVLGQ
jgi:hypothetical protein